jgi:cholesterol transport system auxiliary component
LLEQVLQHRATMRGAAATAAACARPAAPASAAPAPARLQVELEEFSQVFESPQSSHVVLRARARLLAGRTHAILAQQDFDLRSAAPSADAPGAVHGLRDVASSFSLAALAWAASVAAPPCGAAAALPASIP